MLNHPVPSDVPPELFRFKRQIIFNGLLIWQIQMKTRWKYLLNQLLCSFETNTLVVEAAYN